MKRKILAIILTALMVLWIAVPRHIENGFIVESIIDDNMGINVHYPKTGNEKLDKDIYFYVSKIIREHQESGKKDTILHMTFECYSSFFTVIRFTIAYEKENTPRFEYVTKISHKNFFTFTRAKNASSAVIADAGADNDSPTPSKPLNGKKLIALTFDDGPSEHTMKIINILDNYGAKGTFCVLGTKVPSYRQTIEIMHSGGHEIANHTFNHKKLTSLTDDDMLDEIQKTQDAVFKITGEYPRFTRPTYGAFNSKVREGLKMPLLMWNKDTMDWNSKNADYIFKQATKNLKDGDIILFHDVYPTTVQAIEKIVPYLIENDFYPVTVSELMSIKGTNVENGKAYFSAGSSS